MESNTTESESPSPERTTGQTAGASTALPTPACSVIVPAYNAAEYVEEALLSVPHTVGHNGTVQLVVYDDASTDDTHAVLSRLRPRLPPDTILVRGAHGPLGVGSARNRACARASGPILIFHDADDVMRPQRLTRTLAAFAESRADVVGGVFDRIPAGSTPRYEAYHQRLRTEDLQTYAFRDAPLAMPTVACCAAVWQAVPFREGRGVPEDLHFLYGAMKHGFKLHKMLGDSLTGYRYHPRMTSLSLHRRVLLGVRVAAFESLVLGRSPWCDGFSIWGCGRDGKDIFRRLSERAQRKLRAWGEINPRKIGRQQAGRPIVHFNELRAPVVCAVAMDRDGAFERNLRSLNLTSGVDYVHLV